MKVIFLGTSGSTPTKARNLPGIALEYDKDILLFDCGEGTQRQMMQYSVNISKVRAIFLTHTHGDHVIGVAGLVRTLGLNKRTEPLYIYVPEGQQKAVVSLIEFDNALINYTIIIVPIKAGHVHTGDGYSVSAFRVSHTIACYGFVFEEDERLNFITQKAKALGIEGVMFKEIVKRGSLTLNGKRITLASITTKKKGRKFVYATDTKPSKITEKAARDADLLVHEATYTKEYADYAKERGHATAEDVAKIAKGAKVNILALTHISARYKDPKELLDEAAKVFKNTRVASDGMEIEL